MRAIIAESRRDESDVKHRGVGGWAWKARPRGLHRSARALVTSKRLVLNMVLSYLFGMAMTIEQIAEEALALPSESRALLADKLVASLDTAAFSRTDQAWLAEARRRRDDVRSGKVQTIPGDEALANVRRSLGR